MNGTALGAEIQRNRQSILLAKHMRKSTMSRVRYQDVYHKALCYCLGISGDMRRNINSIYDFKTGCVKTECLHEGWQTSGSIQCGKKKYKEVIDCFCN